MPKEGKIDIRQLDLPALEDKLQAYPKFRAKQIHEWLWKKGAHSFDEMTNLSKAFREELAEHFEIKNASKSSFQKSKDGTIKNAVRLHDNQIVESVLIPTEKRITACVSSQVGCSLDCKFCATASLKRMRNLDAAEIVDQVNLIHSQGMEYFNRPLTNIVFMGMGEPLLNYPNLLEAVDKITGKDGLGMSPRRITISTSGVTKMIEKLADEQLKTKLALSLHSAIEKKRNQIMPFSERFPLKDLLKSLQYYYQKTKDRITIEYIVWRGINDTVEDIEALVRFCKAVPSKVNLIEYNSIEDGEFISASDLIISKYIDTLEKNKIVVKVRKSRGADIDAACGQLANKNV